ncbi:TPA: hypothetical protein H1V70_004347 [Salmonella enterica]|nr:hypothetical protein [Salmonella enterica]
MSKAIFPKEWVTVQECMGAPGFPSGAANVRRKLELLASGNPEAKRKREKMKGYEYNIAILPEITKAYFGGGATPRYKAPYSTIETAETDFDFWWSAINKALSQNEKEQIVQAFKEQGKRGVFSDATLDSSVSTMTQSLSQSSINTALMLEALSPETRKEILARYGISEQGAPAAITKEPQKTKKAG